VAKPRTERRRHERRRGVWGASPGIRMALDIIQNWALAEQKNSSGHDFDSHTHAYTPRTSKNSSDFGHYKIQIQFQKYFFRHCIQCKNIKLTLPKIGGPPPLGSATGNYKQSSFTADSFTAKVFLQTFCITSHRYTTVSHILVCMYH